MGQKLFTVNADIMPMGGQMESRALTFLCLARLVYKHRQQSCREIPWLDIKHQAVHTVCGLPLKSNRTPLSILQLEVLKKTILNQLQNSIGQEGWWHWTRSEMLCIRSWPFQRLPLHLSPPNLPFYFNSLDLDWNEKKKSWICSLWINSITPPWTPSQHRHERKQQFRLNNWWPQGHLFCHVFNSVLFSSLIQTDRSLPEG